jgi:hypothetical protein
MHKKPGNVITEVSILLFDDMILIAKVKKFGFALVKPPIPLEEALFIDKPESTAAKNMFQIIHFPFEVYEFQGHTAFDKNSWIQEAESTRARFASLHYEMELGYIRNNFESYKNLSSVKFSPKRPSHSDSHESVSSSSHRSSNRESNISYANNRESNISNGSNRLARSYNPNASDSDFVKRDSYRDSANSKRGSYMQLFKGRKSCDELTGLPDGDPNDKNFRNSGGDISNKSRHDSQSSIVEDKRNKQVSRLSRLTSSMSTILNQGKVSPSPYSTTSPADIHGENADRSSSLVNVADPPETDIDSILAAGEAMVADVRGSADLRYQGRKTFGLIRKETVRK